MFAALLFTLLLFQDAAPPSTQPAQIQTHGSQTLSQSDRAQLRAKAEAGDPSAQFLLGRAYEDGNGIAQNDAQAAAWYRKAADQGNASAQNSLGLMHHDGRGVPRDQHEAVQWYHKAACQKNAAAMFNLGTAYYNGDGVGTDYRLAYAWFLLAQEQGSANAADAVARTGKELMAMEQAEALFAIASMYQKGVDLEQNDHEVIKWLTKAADNGSASAKVEMATMYANGRGVQKDFARALELCQSAAKQNSGPGNYCVGLIYRQGLGVPKSPQMALKWFRNAAEVEHRGATLALVEMYEKGEGTEVNRPEAYYWLYMAYREGVDDAKQHAAKLWKQMQADDIKHVEKSSAADTLIPKQYSKKWKPRKFHPLSYERIQKEFQVKTPPNGVRGEAEQTVEFRHTLNSHNPALPPIYSTPNMIGLMETAAFQALQPYCEDDEITVGTAINIEHRASAGIGSKVKAEAVLESSHGRFHTLRVTARDETRELGRGTVARAAVQLRRVQEKFGNSTQSGSNPWEQQRQKAEAFRALHHGPNILVLPNAWDAASAVILEQSKFPAIATTSGGIAFSLGYPDKQRVARAAALAVIARIARAVKIPVSADVESGYGDRPEDAAQTAQGVIESGAIGLNLEDANHKEERQLVELSLQLEKIKAVRETADKADIPLVLNARTDVYLEQVGSPESRYNETVRRLSAYRDAGADCVFAPGLADAAIIARLSDDLRCPINILASPDTPSVPELQKLGIARVSVGSGSMRTSLGQLRRLAEELKSTGTYKNLDGAIPYAELNQLMSR